MTRNGVNCWLQGDIRNKQDLEKLFSQAYQWDACIDKEAHAVKLLMEKNFALLALYDPNWMRKKQQIILINGEFPGPRLDVVTNDNIVLNFIKKFDQLKRRRHLPIVTTIAPVPRAYVHDSLQRIRERKLVNFIEWGPASIQLESLIAREATEAEIQSIIAEVPGVILRCISRDEAALAVAQKVFKGLYENASNTGHVGAHLAMLAAIRDVSKLVFKELTSWAHGISWPTVIENLDHEGFYIQDETAFSLLISCYRHASHNYGPWFDIMGAGLYSVILVDLKNVKENYSSNEWTYQRQQDGLKSHQRTLPQGQRKSLGSQFRQVTITGIAMGMIKHAACSSVGQGIAREGEKEHMMCLRPVVFYNLVYRVQEAGGSSDGPKRRRTYIYREREEAEQRLIDDYFGDDEYEPKLRRSRSCEFGVIVLVYFKVHIRHMPNDVRHFTDAFDEYLQIAEPLECRLVVNGTHTYRKGYYLADGIYPAWSTFVKTFSVARDEKTLKFKRVQEAARKDIERAFGILDDTFASDMQRLQGNSLKVKDLEPPRLIIEARSILCKATNNAVGAFNDSTCAFYDSVRGTQITVQSVALSQGYEDDDDHREWCTFFLGLLYSFYLDYLHSLH
ncbi:CCR4-NOT transcription complex subunit 1 isoform X1 [Tanacetum coccineum]|uniref:CCR4-NOT transcription complex subunit 1 isoform X1 n=1 Tax=Tanacetum coccineum TaxID=301880 RepID=A0ABQ5E405_9ASTR